MALLPDCFIQQRSVMKLKKYLFVLFFVSNVVAAESYLILSLQGMTGQNNLEHSSSLLTNIGLGLESSSGFCLDWTLGLSGETIAEIILDHDFEHDENKQRGQMDLIAGYKLQITKHTFLKLGAGVEAAVFDRNCAFNMLAGRTVCEKKYEHGPSYKLAYFYQQRKALMFGLEYNRDELSDTRRYNGLAVVVNAGF